MNAKPEAEKIRTFPALRKYREKNPDCFTIIAHPYFPGIAMFYDIIRRNMNCFDGVELSWWYSKLINFNRRGKTLANHEKLPFIGTSDTHNLKWFGITHCEITSPKLEAKEILSSLHKNKLKNTSTPIPTWEMLFLMPLIIIRDKLWLLKETIKKFKIKDAG
ncbi:MAG: PHP-associated domain-containing protein [Patescibacteria group bacterium]|nr:hypothetical protein [Patescibacteria group bacterium]